MPAERPLPPEGLVVSNEVVLSELITIEIFPAIFLIVYRGVIQLVLCLLNAIKIMHKLYVSLATGFGLFLICIVYSANTGTDMAIMQWVRSFDHGDKVAHFLLFGVLSFLLNFAFKARSIKLGRWSIYSGTALVVILALFEEFSQHFIATRMFDYFDLLADLTGIFVFALFTRYWLGKSRML